ncbi:MAG: GPW/gp25 family protein [Pseudomonadota bacterium]|nr:GPW/gp25 family protein [Pseudomonadota bacterium]
MIGMHARSGRAFDGIDHLAQSIADILTTPIGTRIMRRDYGSLLPELIDTPDTGASRVRLYGAIATALMRWEPRLRVTRLGITRTATPGAVNVDIEGERIDITHRPAATRLSIPLPIT